MIFAVDIGNTNIVIGGAERQGKICFTERISTDHKATDFEYAVSFKSIFEIHNVSPHDIEGAIISSVVPFVTNTVKSAVKKIMGITPMVVGPGIKTGLSIKIDNPAVRSKVKTVQATLPVKTSKEVDLVVNFVPAAGSTLDTMQYTVSPDKVTLVGEKDVLDTIDAIVLDTLYLQDLQPSQSLTYSVTAPEGTTLAENVGPVTVTIVVTGVTERNVTVTAFNCENVPDGFSAVPVTESLNILLRGLESEMAQITAEDLRITVDLSGITEPGVHTVPVTVQVANFANVGVKGSYQIVVDVERLP